MASASSDKTDMDIFGPNNLFILIVDPPGGKNLCRSEPNCLCPQMPFNLLVSLCHRPLRTCDKVLRQSMPCASKLCLTGGEIECPYEAFPVGRPHKRSSAKREATGEMKGQLTFPRRSV